MIVENPKYYMYKQMKKVFKGYCVCVAKIKKEGQRLIGGIVITMDPDVNVVMDEALYSSELSKYISEWTSLRNFTHPSLVESGIVQVIFHENRVGFSFA